MSGNKTQPTDASVDAFIAAVEHPRRREDAQVLRAMMQRIAGEPPVMWGDSLIGFGSYAYRYDSGREGTFFRTGFSPRKANLSIYLMPGYDDLGAQLARLGKHKKGRACLYITRLDQVDLDVLEGLIRHSYERMAELYPA